MKKYGETLILTLVLLIVLNPLPAWASAGLAQYAAPRIEKITEGAVSKISTYQAKLSEYGNNLRSKFTPPDAPAIATAPAPAAAAFSSTTCADRITNHTQLNNYAAGTTDGDGNPVNEYTETTQTVSGLNSNVKDGYWSLKFRASTTSCCFGGLQGWIWVNNVLYLTITVDGDGRTNTFTTSNGAIFVSSIPAFSNNNGVSGDVVLRIPWVSKPDTATIKVGIDAHPAPQLDMTDWWIGCEALRTAIPNPSPAPPVVGTNSTYTVNVYNSGVDFAESASAKIQVPAGMNLISASGTGWTCSPTSGSSPLSEMNCTYTGSILPLSLTNYPISVVVKPITTGAMTMKASVNPTVTGSPLTASTCTGTNTPSLGCSINTQTAGTPTLRVAKAAPSPALTIGSNSTYAITVTNTGTSAASQATITDVLPTGLDLISTSGTGWTCSPSSGSSPVGTVTCNFTGSIAASGGTSIVNLVVKPAKGYGGTSVTNYVSVDPSSLSSPPTATTCTALNTPTAGCGAPVTSTINGPKLAISKSSPPLVVGVNSTYTITVTNIGNQAATTARVSEVIASGLDLISATGTGWTCSPGSGSSPVGTVTCNFTGSIAAGGGTSTIAVTVRPTTAGASISNYYSVDPDGSTAPPTAITCTGTDAPSRGCGAPVGPTTVAAPVTLNVSKSSPTLGEGVNSTYTITVTNSGAAAATTAQVKDALQAGLNLISATGTGWSCSPGSGSSPVGTITCNYTGSIAASGGTSTITIVAQPASGTAGTSVTNKVSVDTSGGSSAPDPTTCTGTNTPTAGCGNVAGPTMIAPPAPVAALISTSPEPTNGPLTVTGSAGAVTGNSTVTVKNADNSVLCTTTAAANGSFSCAGTTNGGPLSITAANAGGTSPATSKTITFDNVAPNAPTGTASPNPTNGPVTITGNAETGSTVTVRNPDSSVVCTTTATVGGTFSCAGTANGGPLSATATDAASNTSSSGSIALTFDNVAPSAPTGTASPNPTSGAVTVSGNAEAGSTVTVRNADSSILCTTTATVGGTYSCAGTATGAPLSATATDSAGNVSPATSIPLTIDTTPPAAPTGTANPNPTNGPVTISGGAGAAEPGSTITIEQIDGTAICTTTAAADGSYSCSGTATDGPLSATATDSVGNVSPATSIPLTFDNTAPAAPTGTASPNPTSGAVTVNGNAEPNSTVTVKNQDGTTICTTTATGGGTYSCSGTAVNAPLSVTATDSASNVSPATSVPVIIDTTAPSAPTGTASPNPSNGPVTISGNAEAGSTVTIRNPDSSVICTTTAAGDGSFSCAGTANGGPLSATATDNVGNTSTPGSIPLTFDNIAPSAPTGTASPNPTSGAVTVSGNAEAGSTVVVKNPDGTTVCTTNASDGGTYSCAGTATGGPLTATATDGAGNTSPVTSVPLTVDTSAPTAPDGSKITVSPNPSNGPVTITGVAGAVEPGSTVTIKNPDGTTICSTNAAGDGSFSCSGTANGGPLSATATDGVGNISPSTSLLLTFDNVAPTAPTGTASPNSTSGAVTISGNAEANSTVTIRNPDSSVVCITTATAGGGYSCSGTATGGPLSVVATDAAGNTSPATSVPLTVDTTAPTAPDSSKITVSPNPTNGPVTITGAAGAAEPGSTVTIKNPDGTTVCTATATGDGSFSCSGTANSGPLSATATDSVGNVSPTTTLPLTFDNTAPTAPDLSKITASPNPTNGPVTITGSTGAAEAGSTITVKNPDGTTVCTTTAAGDGSFSCSGTANGGPLSATSTDAAGNTSSPTSVPLTFDNTAPSAPDASKISVSPNPTNGPVTITGATGAAEPGSIVTIKNPDGTTICTTTAAGDGSFTCSGTATGGPLSATATDSAGNTSPATNLPLTFDNTAPSAPAGTASPNPSNGPVTITGTSEPGSTVTIKNPDGTSVCTAIAAGDGSFTCAGTATGGPLSVTATDSVGNVSPGASIPLTFDNSAPSAPDASKITVNPNPTNGPVTITGATGAVEPGSTVTIKNPDGTTVCTAVVAGDGSFTCSGTASGGPLSATATDNAGNVSPTATLPLTFDNTAPSAPTGSASPNPTNGPVSVTGNAEPGTTVTIKNPDGTTVCTATAAGDGSFSCSGAATGGPLSVTATDTAGNTSSAGSIPLVFDNSAPSAPDVSKINASPNPTNGPVTVTGTAGAAEPGSTVTIKNPDGTTICSTTVAGDGSFSCSGTATGGPLSATATDAAGNTSPGASIPLTFDNTAPSVPNAVTASPNPTSGPVTVSGNADAGSTITVKNPDGTTICTTTATAGGTFSCSGTATGGPLNVTATDAAGNTSTPVSVPLTVDNTAPVAPDNTKITASPNPTNGPVTITGSTGAAEPGSTVTIKNPDGTTVCTTTATADGSFSCSGTATGGPLSATATDSVGNTSPSTSLPLTFDNVAPTTPTGTASPNPTNGPVTVSGNAEPGSTVDVKNSDGTTICSTTVAVDGSFTCSGTTTGGPLSVTATDPAGNTSPILSVPITLNTSTNLTLNLTTNPSGVVVPGQVVTFTLDFANETAILMKNIAVTIPIPNALDFKVDSLSANLQTSGLTLTMKYSNDNGATWTYTPVSGGGGAPAGYDRNVNAIRAEAVPTQTLSFTPPNNSATIIFQTRVR